MMASWNEEGISRDYNDNKRQKPVYSQSFGRGGRGSRGRRNDRFDHQNDNRERMNRDGGYRRDGNDEKTITIDSTKVGVIIGRGGAKIRQLEQDSGARIFINKNDRTETTPVRVQGSQADVEKACEMIENLLSDSSFNSGGYNRNDRDDRRSYNTNRSYENRNNDYSKNDNDSQSHYSHENNGFKKDYNSQSQNTTNNDNFEKKTYQNENPNEEEDVELINWQEIYEKSERKEAERLAKLPKIAKQTYIEDPEVTNLSAKQVAEFRKNNMNISVSRVFAESDDQKTPIPNPVLTFEHAFNSYPDILQTIKNQNFTEPSPIQSQAWPVIMAGEDMIGIAQTGTGKTLAFLLPAFLHIEAQPTPRSERLGPTVLILSPTRELALQIEKEINKYSYRDIKCVCVYGGGSRKDQIAWIHRDRPEIIVATPGRLDDLVYGCEVKLDSVSYVVLDEADKMLEMGFECQIRKILLFVRKDRQSIMTSATWPSGVRRLASQYSVNPIQVVVGSLDLAAVHSVSQKIMIVDEDDKRAVLQEFLSNMEPEDKAIVFCGKKSVTDDIASDLALKGVSCQSLHGDREQYDREQALHDLKTGKVRILIATDVAARGIDIVDITHIFNLDFPKNIEEYVHRIGRTGRAGRTGESISLFTRRDWANAGDLIKILEEANQGVPEELIDMSRRFEARKERDAFDRRGGRGGRRGGGGGFGGRRGRY